MVLGGGLTAVSGLERDSELLVWISLRRVHAGGVAKVAGWWLDAGRPVPGYLTDTLDDVTGAGLVALADDGPHGPLRRATLTDGGQVRYATSLQRHGGHLERVDLRSPAPGFGTETPTGRRSSDPRPPAPGDRPGPTPDTEEDLT